MADDSDSEKQDVRLHADQPYDESLEIPDSEEVASIYTPTPRVAPRYTQQQPGSNQHGYLGNHGGLDNYAGTFLKASAAEEKTFIRSVTPETPSLSDDDDDDDEEGSTETDSEEEGATKAKAEPKKSEEELKADEERKKKNEEIKQQYMKAQREKQDAMKAQMEAQQQQMEEYEKQRQQQIEHAKKLKEDQEKKKQAAKKKEEEEEEEESSGEEESGETESGSEESDDEDEEEEKQDGKKGAGAKAEDAKKAADVAKQKKEIPPKEVQDTKKVEQSTKTPVLQPIKRQDDALLGASPRPLEGKVSPALSLPSIVTKGGGAPLRSSGLAPVAGANTLKGASGKAALLPLGKGKKKKDRGRSRGDTPPEHKMSDQSEDEFDTGQGMGGLGAGRGGAAPLEGLGAKPPGGGQMYQDDEDEEEGSTETDDDDDDDEGSGGAIEGAYDPADYEHLPVTPEIKELFQYITRYTPQTIDLEHKLKPFIPDFIPAVGDIDAFIKITRPDNKPDQLGLNILDEPCAKQSDPTVLDLQLRSISKQTNLKAVVVKSIESAEKNPRAVNNWIQSISEIHRTRPPPNVHYTKNMPNIDDLMQEWPENFEELLKEISLPTAEIDCDLSTYIDMICALLDIPIYKSKIQSLHVLFTLYSEFKNSQHFRALAEENKLDNNLKGGDGGGPGPMGGDSDTLVL